MNGWNRYISKCVRATERRNEKTTYIENCEFHEKPKSL